MDNINVKYKINRFFYVVTNPRTNLWLIVINLIMVLGMLLGIVKYITVGIACLVIINIIMVFDLFFHSPGELAFNEGVAEFDEYVRMKPKTSPFVVTRGIYVWVKIGYSVSNVRDVQFHQNFFEKIFNIGRISFSGKETFTVKQRYENRIKKKNNFKIYGIKNFSHFFLLSIFF